MYKEHMSHEIALAMRNGKSAVLGQGRGHSEYNTGGPEFRSSEPSKYQASVVNMNHL